MSSSTAAAPDDLLVPKLGLSIATGDLIRHITHDYYSVRKDHPIIGSCIFLVAFTSFVLLVRLISRVYLVKQFGLDDGLAIVAWILFIAFASLVLVNLQTGGSRMLELMEDLAYPVDIDLLKYLEKIDWVAHLIYVIALVVCRLSGLALYHRLCGVHRRLIRTIWVFGYILVAIFISQIVLLVLHCRPFTLLWYYEWQPGASEYTCLPWGVVYSYSSGSSVVCDILVFSIPVMMIQALKLPRWRKIQLGVILLPGACITIISAFRLWLVIQGQWDHSMIWYYGPQLIVETAEIGATIIALSVPAWVPVADKVMYWTRGLADALTLGSRDKEQETQGSNDHFNLRLRPPNELLCSRDAWVESAGGFRRMSEPVKENQSYSTAGAPDGILVQVDFHLNADIEACEACHVRDGRRKYSTWTETSEY